jgi:hypothetical protein
MSENNLSVFSAMQTGDPYKTYKKVILGKVYLRVLDPFDDKPVGVHLVGNPKRNSEGCFFYTWNEKQDVFLRRMNKPHFKSGMIIETELKPKKEDQNEKLYSDYSEKDIEEIVTSKFFKLKEVLEDAESEAFVYRILTKAEELERPEATMKAIKERLSDIQSWEVTEDVNTN